MPVTARQDLERGDADGQSAGSRRLDLEREHRVFTVDVARDGAGRRLSDVAVGRDREQRVAAKLPESLLEAFEVAAMKVQLHLDPAVRDGQRRRAHARIVGVRVDRTGDHRRHREQRSPSIPHRVLLRVSNDETRAPRHPIRRKRPRCAQW